MNFTEAETYLHTISKTGSVFGLATIRELLQRLGDPQNTLKFIQIAGTNGKGSVLACLSTVLTQAGYCTGRYFSPHMASYRETIQVNGEPMEKASMARHLTEIQKAARQMEEEGMAAPTYFESLTALAFLYFREKDCDVVVLEAGLGGRLDATNVVTTTILELIVSIGMDHMDVLGNTIEEITAEKAGIIKPNTIVVSAPQKPAAREVLEAICRERGCTFRCVEDTQIKEVRFEGGMQQFSYKSWKNVAISLAGTYQVNNASLALEGVEALRKLGFSLSDRQVYEGMARAAWWGRFTQIAKEPTVIVDGAHNEDGARALRDSLERYYKGRRLYYIFGVFQDKAYQKIIQLTAPLAEYIITVQTPNNPRALPARTLKEAVAAVNPNVEAAGSIPDAVRKLNQMAKKDDVIIIFGSLSFLKEAERAVLEEDHHG